MIRTINKGLRYFNQPLRFKFCNFYIDYKNIDLNFLKQVNESCQFLLSLEEIKLKKSFEIFRENIYPPQNREFISQQLSELYDEESNKNVYLSLKYIFQFIDRGYVGFLSGDLDSQILPEIQNQLSKALNQIQEGEQNDDFKHQLINKVYQTLKTQIIDQKRFGLPQFGIKNPDFESKRNLFERQIILENETNNISVEKFQNVVDQLNDFEKTQNLSLSYKYLIEWFPLLCKQIKDEQQICKEGKLKGDRKIYAKYILLLPAEKLTIIALSELMKSILKQILSYNEDDNKNCYNQLISKVLFMDIGKEINQQLLMNEIQVKVQSEKDQQGIKNNYQDEILLKRITRDFSQKQIIPKNDQIILGSVLTFFMKELIKIKTSESQIVSLMTPGYQQLKETKKYIGVMIIEDEFIQDLFKQLTKEESMFIQLTRSLPMIYKPSPWFDNQVGGYYQKPTKLMRIQDNQLHDRALMFADLSQTYQVLDSINQTPWRINQKVLQTIEQIWDEGGNKGEIPQKFNNYENFVYDYQISETYNYKEKQKLSKQLQLQRDMNSLKCSFLLQLSVAKAFKDCKKIYFPHNLDFRGRTYPIPPHLNHIGADISRGLLEFSDGKELGNNGLKWLKIHLANKMGKDKLNTSDKLIYVQSQLEDIKKMAQDPISNQQWLECEDCWQTLASIFELQAALDSPDPTKYVSHLHVHQDGSCNGLQHYAALGRDLEGAFQVNLQKRDKPGDVYTHVSKMVEQKILQDLANPEFENKEVAQMLTGKIKRKVVKQTVMTSVYGVTFIGAKDQIKKQLKDYKIVNDEFYFAAARYIAQKTLESIKDLFSGAHAIKQWLLECAQLISEKNQPLCWITPLGLPIIQPYRKSSQVDVIRTIVQNVQVTKNSKHLPIAKQKQQSAFPPNFIHSLDSTHMLFTAQACYEKGITFAAVHDSFWTHACDIDIMNKTLRDQFVRLHSQPLLEDLLHGFQLRFPNIEFPPIPRRGDFNLEDIKQSEYFFS